MRYLIPILLTLALSACPRGYDAREDLPAATLEAAEGRGCWQVLAEVQASAEASRDVCDYWMLQRCGCVAEEAREPSRPPACEAGL